MNQKKAPFFFRRKNFRPNMFVILSNFRPHSNVNTSLWNQTLTISFPVIQRHNRATVIPFHRIESKQPCNPFVGIRIRWNWIHVASEIEFSTFFSHTTESMPLAFFHIDFGFAMQFRTPFRKSSSSRCYEMKTKLFYIRKMTLSPLHSIRLI